MASSKAVLGPLPQTLGELRSSQWTPERVSRSVKDELRDNLITRLRSIRNSGESLFPGIVGYDDTVIPQIVNAVLSRHNFILLGLRGQAKSRILRALTTTLLDPQIPFVAGSELRDNPYAPLSKFARDLIVQKGDSTPIAWLDPQARYVEKLATPDVTVADLIGDVDPIKAARSGHELGSELTMHYGLLPPRQPRHLRRQRNPRSRRQNPGRPLQHHAEGDVQIKGYPVRLELDVAIVFSANPEDYTARGKIVTPLKDRIGSEIRTHYPESIDDAIAITEQEAWTARTYAPSGDQEDTVEAIFIPHYIRQVVESVAFAAREDKKVDKRSGVSQRLPISTMELVVSNAERRALLHGESTVVPRIGDIYAALPGITGKIELEYEGEMRGARHRHPRDHPHLRRLDLRPVFQGHQHPADRAVVQHLGGTVQLNDAQPAADSYKELQQIQGLFDKLSPLEINAKSSPEVAVSAAEFLLEGMTAHKRISRSEERAFSAAEKKTRNDQAAQYAERMRDMEREEPSARNRTRRGFN